MRQRLCVLSLAVRLAAGHGLRCCGLDAVGGAQCCAYVHNLGAREHRACQQLQDTHSTGAHRDDVAAVAVRVPL